MSDIQARGVGGKPGESYRSATIGKSNPSSAIGYPTARAWERRASRPPPTSGPQIDPRELTADLLIFLLQIAAPEKYGKYQTGEKAGGKIEGGMEKSESGHEQSNQSSMISHQSGDFVPEAAGGEALMPTSCPELRGGGGVRAGGVKALPMHRERSPRPGGITERREKNEPDGALRRADGGLAGTRRRKSESDQLPVSSHQSPSDFVPETAGGESLMPTDCPEFGGGDGVQDGGVKASRRRGTQSTPGGQSSALWERHGDEETGRPGDMKVGPGKSRAAAGVCHPGVGDSIHRLPGVSLRATPWLPAGIPPGCARDEARETPKSRRDFVLHGADGEELMAREFPEFAGVRWRSRWTAARWRRLPSLRTPDLAELEWPQPLRKRGGDPCRDKRFPLRSIPCTDVPGPRRGQLYSIDANAP